MEHEHASARAVPSGWLAATRGAFWTRLLLPRSRDAVLKWLFLPVGALVGLCAVGRVPDAGLVLQLVVLWVVAEQLAYQARYLVNDLRDVEADASHPAGLQKSRLGFPLTRGRLAGLWASVALRVGLALALTVAVLEEEPREAAVAFLVLLLPVSLVYETVRERVRRNPASPGTPAARRLAVPVLLAVPLGYGLRVWAGYHAVTGGAQPWWHGGLLVVTAMLLQAATVLLGWSLEGTAFLDGSAEGFDPRLRARAHIGFLLERSGLLRRGGAGGAGDDEDPRALVLARDRPAAGPWDLRVWDVLAVLAVLGSVVTAVVLVDAPATAAAAAVGLALLLVAAPSVVHGWAARRRRTPGRPWLGRGGLAVVVTAEVLLWTAALAVLLVHDPALVRLWWLPAFALAQWGFVRASSYRRGFGPLSLVRRPLAWVVRRARRGEA